MTNGTENRLLLDARADAFLAALCLKCPDELKPLGDAIGQLDEVMRISQISVCGVDGTATGLILYKKYDTKLLNAPDWYYMDTLENGRQVMVEFWKDGKITWDETDIKNMTALSRFAILYANGMQSINDALSASVRDASSGLANVTGLTNAIQNLINQKVSHCYSIFYVSTHKFQLISQKYGYEIGNQLMLKTFKQLKDYTTRLQSEQIVARMVNDNLTMIVHNSNVAAYLTHLTKMELGFMYLNERVLIPADFRIGICQMKKEEQNAQLPMEYAMTANGYAQKTSLKNVIYYTDEIHQRFLREKEIEARMLDGIEKEEFIVYYQPKINLKSNTLVGAEALVRWKVDNEVVTPNEFIPIFEKNGFICQLDFYVLDCVCRNLRAWLDVGMEVVKTSVNFSRLHLAEPTFTKHIIEVLREYRIPAKYIEIEFTETGDTEASDRLANAIESLKDYGIATAMDDFGSGYSSLSLLTNLSFDILKIDKSFFEAGEISEKEKVVINNIIRMVQALNIDVIMEGVETLEQVRFLKDAKCDMAQGYIYDMPLPISEFEKRLLNKTYCIGA